MKRMLSVVLLMVMVCALCACGKTQDNIQNLTVVNQTGTAHETEYFDKLGYALPGAFEVVYNNSEVISYRHGFAYVFTFVGLKMLLTSRFCHMG